MQKITVTFKKIDEDFKGTLFMLNVKWIRTYVGENDNSRFGTRIKLHFRQIEFLLETLHTISRKVFVSDRPEIQFTAYILIKEKSESADFNFQ